MSLSPIGSAVFELLSRKHTDIRLTNNVCSLAITSLRLLAFSVCVCVCVCFHYRCERNLIIILYGEYKRRIEFHLEKLAFYKVVKRTTTLL